MPYKDPRNPKYLKRRSEQIKEKRKIDDTWREEVNKKNKEWYDNNKEKAKIYRQSDKAIKSRHISHWKGYGVELNCDFSSWELLYDYYLSKNNCEICGTQFYLEGRKNNKNLDHNHTTKQFRWVVCSKCNNKLGKTDKNFNLLMRELKLLFNPKSVFLAIKR